MRSFLIAICAHCRLRAPHSNSFFLQLLICAASIFTLNISNSTKIKIFPLIVRGGLPVHLWHGRQGLPSESHLRDARVPSPWLRPRWRAHQHLPHVRLKPIAVRLDADNSVLQPKSIIVPEQDGGVHQRRGDGQAGRGVLQV